MSEGTVCIFHAWSIDRSRAKNQNGEISIADITKGLPYADDQFDVVFSKSMLEHFYHPEIVIAGMHRVLKPGGVLIAMVPDWQTCWKLFYNDPFHCHPFTQKGLHDSLLIAGFEKVETEIFYQLPFLWTYPKLAPLCRLLSFLVPVYRHNNLLRFSRHLMLLSSAYKGDFDEV